MCARNFWGCERETVYAWFGLGAHNSGFALHTCVGEEDSLLRVARHHVTSGTCPLEPRAKLAARCNRRERAMCTFLSTSSATLPILVASSSVQGEQRKITR